MKVERICTRGVVATSRLDSIEDAANATRNGGRGEGDDARRGLGEVGDAARSRGLRRRGGDL